MASYPPRTATSWLLSAANKLEKSIFRKIEYKYRNRISELTTQIKELEKRVELVNNEAIKFEDIGDQRLYRIQELEAKLRAYEKPVATKDLREEVFRVKTVTEQTISEESVKTIVEAPKEINIFSSLRDAPASKILEIGPPPRSILQIVPLLTTENKKSKKRERSTSPKPVRRAIHVPILLEENANQPDPTLTPPNRHCFRVPPVSSNKMKKKKRKRKREKDDS